MHAATTMTVTTTPETSSNVPHPPGQPPTPSRRTAGLWIALAVTVGLLVTVVSLGSIIEIPYVAIAPGSARATEPLVSIEGVETYDAAGEFYFLTAQLYDTSLIEAAGGWLDPDIDIVPVEAVRPRGVTEQENDLINAQAMVGSKETAAVVALTRLGYDLSPTGTGAVILEVTADSPADGVLDVSDTVVSVDGRPITVTTELGEAIGALPPGATTVLGVEDIDRVAREVTVVVGARPDDPSKGFLGVATETRDFDPGLPFDVSIDSGQVGGPSAGLAFTLSILDLLTPGELTGGHRVAVTGTIQPDGTVGNVEGYAQKAAAAAGQDAEVFIVPRAGLEEAQAHAHGMDVVAVDDLDGALAALVAIGGEPLQ
jgi:PDZ domain-containing protein